VSAELAGRLTSPVVRAEQSSESLGPKNAKTGPAAEVCGACEDGRAQHDVLRYHQGAQTPNPDDVGKRKCSHSSSKRAVADGSAATGTGAAASSSDMSKGADAPVAEPGKEKPYYGTEWAGRTAPDGTQVPRLAVCDFGYGHNAAPNAGDAQQGPPVPEPMAPQ
jgi:hypothetical protein